MFNSQIRELAASIITGQKLDNLAKEVRGSLDGNIREKVSIARADIVDHATNKVPFYQNYRGMTFYDLPVISKSIIKRDLKSFISIDASLDRLTPSSTSGSTGIPFTAYFDEEKLLHHRAGLVGSFRFMGAEPYGPIIFARAWSKLSLRDHLILKLKDHLPYAGIHQDDRSLKEIAHWINRRRNVTIMGYSSYVEGLLRAIEESKVKIKPGAVTAIIGGSEAASDYLNQASLRLFSVPAHMRYSNMELGIVAVTGNDFNVYNIDTSSYFVEILEESSDNPVAPGSSGRLVITDLHNKSMPFIRYDTGDLAQFWVDEAGKERRDRITQIKGRKLDVLYAGSKEFPRKIHAMQVFWGATSKISELYQFQLQQHDYGKFTWVLVAQESDALEKKLYEILENAIGAKIDCKFIYVDEIPLMASGKRKFFVNEMASPD